MLRYVPVDAREEVEEIFRKGMTASGHNAVGVFLLMVRVFDVDLEHQGIT